MDHLIKSRNGVSQSMEGVGTHADLTSPRKGKEESTPTLPQHQSHLPSVPQRSPQMGWEMPRRKENPSNLSTSHTVVLKEPGFLGQRTNLLSKAQPCQRIRQQNFHFKLIRKAEIRPRIIFVPQRVREGGLKADCTNPIGTSFCLLQNWRLLAFNIAIN